jgi:hypothetical protein
VAFLFLPFARQTRELACMEKNSWTKEKWRTSEKLNLPTNKGAQARVPVPQNRKNHDKLKKV